MSATPRTTHEKLYYSNVDTESKNLLMHQSMRLNWVNHMISRVEAAKGLEGNGTLHPKAREALQQYEVLEITNSAGKTEKKLFTKPSPGVLWEVVPLTETYALVVKAHMNTHHGNVDDMQTWLANENMCVAPICLPVIIDICTICQEKRNTLQCKTPDVQNTVQKAFEIGTNQAENVGLLETQLSSDFQKFTQIADTDTNVNKCVDVKLKILQKSDPSNSITRLLIKKSIESGESDKLKLKDLVTIIDLNTGFVHLRPVHGWDVETLTPELMDMLNDLGPPDTFLVPSSMKTLMAKVIERLNEIFCSSIELGIMEVPPQIEASMDKAIKEWSNTNILAGNWDLGCYHVQWTLNNIPGIGRKSALAKMLTKNVSETKTYS